MKCPPFTDLSAWMDGEGEHGVGEHVAQCPLCGRTVGFYRRVDEAIVTSLQPAPDLASRIKVACAQEQRLEALRFWPGSTWRIAAAAAFVLLGGLSTYVYVFRSQPNTPAPMVADSRMPVPPIPASGDGSMTGSGTGQEMVPNGDDYVWDNEAEEWVPRGSVRAADLMMASAGVAESAGGERGVREMADAVRHVWVVSDAGQTDAILRRSLPPELATQLQTLPAGQSVTLRLFLKDRELQAVVDKLANAGFSLVSPQLPQPGEARRILAVDKSVLYEAELVPASSPR